MSKLSEYSIRPVSKEEFTIAVEWAAKEGWNPGLNDTECYFKADPSGFLMGFLGEEPIASISVVKYSSDFGFLGFYIVKPEYRGQGYGIKIWEAGMQYLKGCNVGLDGVVEQQDNYKKSGFKLAYSNLRYEGKGGAKNEINSQIMPVENIALNEIIAYNRSFFPEDREEFLQAWISQANASALCFIEEGSIAGFGVIRPCRNGYKIGPLYANNALIAEDLLNALKAKVESTNTIYLDVPELNKAAVEMAERHEMNVVFGTARMYTGDFPELPTENLYGVTSFEMA